MTKDPLHLVGTTVADRYRVLRFLASGSTSAVYEIEDREGRRAALKVLSPVLAREPVVAARFAREAKTMTMFQHRNIVDLRDAGALANHLPFIVTELVHGVSVRDLIADGLVEPRRALAIARQVLDALAHAHARGVIHRDIKPENIMLVDGGDPEGDADFVKVLDFGVAKLLGDAMAVLGERTLTHAGCNVLGTPLYLAPEPLLGRIVDARADLYSVGIVLFEMLTGKPPFEATDPIVAAQLHARSPVPKLATALGRSVTAELEYVIVESLAKQPERRFRTALEMIHAIDAAVRSFDVDALGATEAVVCAAPRPAATTPVAPAPILPAPRPASVRIARRSRGEVWKAVRAPEHRRIVVGGGVGFVVFAIAIAAAAGGRTGEASKPPPVAALTAPAPEPALHAVAEDPLARGHAELERGRPLEALAAYEQAIAHSPDLATSSELRTNVIAIVESRDPLAAVVALEVLATRVSPPERDAIIAQASAGKVREVRRRAFAIAERDGFIDQVDQIASWMFDLRHATTCEERAQAIAKLRVHGDRRAIPLLRRAKTHPCVERDAADAIAQLAGGS